MAKKPVKKQVGRPTSFTDNLGLLICERIAEGESLRSVCKDPKMPSMSMVFRWLADDRYKLFREHYEEAKATCLEAMADEMLEIADEPVNSTVTGATDSGMVQKQRLKIDTRKWILSKLVPKKYGDKLDLNHGVQPDNPLMSVIQRVAGTGLPIVKDKAE